MSNIVIQQDGKLMRWDDIQKHDQAVDRFFLGVIIAAVVGLVVVLSLIRDGRLTDKGQQIVKSQMATNEARGYALSPKEAR